MVRGLITGIVSGAVASGVVLVIASQMLPTVDLSDEIPNAGEASIPAGSAFNAELPDEAPQIPVTEAGPKGDVAALPMVELVQPAPPLDTSSAAMPMPGAVESALAAPSAVVGEVPSVSAEVDAGIASPSEVRPPVTPGLEETPNRTPTPATADVDVSPVAPVGDSQPNTPTLEAGVIASPAPEQTTRPISPEAVGTPDATLRPEALAVELAPTAPEGDARPSQPTPEVGVVAAAPSASELPSTPGAETTPATTAGPDTVVVTTIPEKPLDDTAAVIAPPKDIPAPDSTIATGETPQIEAAGSPVQAEVDLVETESVTSNATLDTSGLDTPALEGSAVGTPTLVAPSLDTTGATPSLETPSLDISSVGAPTLDTSTPDQTLPEVPEVGGSEDTASDVLAPSVPTPSVTAPSVPAPSGPAPTVPAPEPVDPDVSVAIASPPLTFQTPLIPDQPTLGAPVVEDTALPDAVESTELVEGPAIEAFAVPFEAASSKPRLALVLLDGPGAQGLDLSGLSIPIGVAVDPLHPEAKARMAALRGQGIEVLVLTPLIAEASPSDVEVSFQGFIRAVPEAVAIMDTPDNVLQASRPRASQVVDILKASGHGLVTYNKGLNSILKLADREDVPALRVVRVFDQGDSDGRRMKRFLDQGAFQTGQEGHAILLGHLRPEVVETLLDWSTGNRASTIELAPVSAVLMGM